MKSITLILLTSLLLSLSVYAEKPEWIADSKQSCPANFLCAIGEGPSYNTAASSARNALALIFESKIKSNLSAQETSIASDVQINVTEEINQSADALLNGVTIIKSYDDASGFYILAGLNKQTSGKMLKEKIKEVDDEMTILAKSPTRLAGEKLLRWHLKRIPIHSNYQVLTGMSVAQPISYKSILQMKELKAKGPALKLIASNETNLFNKNYLEELFISLGHRMSVPSDEAFVEIVYKTEKKKEYINIDGFERYTYTLTITAKKAEQKLGVINLISTKTARNEEQAWAQAKQEIETQLKDKILELNIE